MNSTNYNKQLQCENAGRGEGSFGIITYTSGQKEKDGYHYYDIYLWSNSFYENGVPCSSYIKNIKVFVWKNGTWSNVINFPYALVHPPSETFDGYYHLTYIYNATKVNNIKITWSEVTTY